jgi:L-malate glycosyltransferase
MKIGLIYDAAYPWSKGGGEKHLYDLAQQLVLRGHEVHLFCMQYWDGPADLCDNGVQYHGLCPRMPLYNAQGKRSITAPLSFAWAVLTRLPKRTMHGLDIVDVNAFPFLSVVTFWIAHRLFFPSVPWLVTWLEVWGLQYWRRYLGLPGWAGAAVELLAARVAPAHLCISQLTATRLHKRLGVPYRHVELVPRGLDLPAGFPRGTPKAPHRVVIVGRLIGYKRVDLIIRAWPEVVGTIPSAELRITGDGPERVVLTTLVQTLGLKGSITFLGQLAEHEAVLAEIEKASLLVLPSEREGQGLVVLEAMALGTAVLVADGMESATSEFLTTYEQRRWSLLPWSADAATWAERIGQLLGNAELLRRLAAEGKEGAIQYGWHDQVVPRMERLYQERIAATVNTGRLPSLGARFQQRGGPRSDRGRARRSGS